MQIDIHVAFIDYEKAFDRVKHEILMKDLKMIGTDDKDTEQPLQRSSSCYLDKWNSQ